MGPDQMAIKTVPDGCEFVGYHTTFVTQTLLGRPLQ